MTSPSADSLRESVCSAIALGWQTTRLATALSSTGPNGTDPDRKRRVLALQIGVSLRGLGPVFDTAGIAPPNAAVLVPANGTAVDAAALQSFATDVSDDLTAADPRLGKAYKAGQTLALLVSSTPALGELKDLRQRLQDLRSILPPHSAKAVIDSIDYWQIYTEKNSATVSASIADLLPHQGRRWRGVLTGEKAPSDLLSTDDYLKAGSGILDGYMALGTDLLRRYWRYLLPIVAAVVAVVGVVWWRYGTSASSAFASAAAVLAAVGVTGRSVSAALSRTASGVEDSLPRSRARYGHGNRGDGATSRKPCLRGRTEEVPSEATRVPVGSGRFGAGRRGGFGTGRRCDRTRRSALTVAQMAFARSHTA